MNPPTVKEFLRVLVTDWTSGISGGLSVPFTFLALFWKDASTKALFAVLAILALLIAVYRIWEMVRLYRARAVLPSANIWAMHFRTL